MEGPPPPATACARPPSSRLSHTERAHPEDRVAVGQQHVRIQQQLHARSLQCSGRQARGALRRHRAKEGRHGGGADCSSAASRRRTCSIASTHSAAGPTRLADGERPNGLPLGCAAGLPGAAGAAGERRPQPKRPLPLLCAHAAYVAPPRANSSAPRQARQGDCAAADRLAWQPTRARSMRMCVAGRRPAVDVGLRPSGRR